MQDSRTETDEMKGAVEERKKEVEKIRLHIKHNTPMECDYCKGQGRTIKSWKYNGIKIENDTMRIDYIYKYRQCEKCKGKKELSIRQLKKEMGELNDNIEHINGYL